MPATSILSIPVELAQRILCFCSPHDVYAFARSSRAAHALISTDQFLWRQLFLALPFDHPLFIYNARNAAHLPDRSNPEHFTIETLSTDWKTALTTRLHAERIALDPDVSGVTALRVIDLFLAIAKNTAPAEDPALQNNDLAWLTRVLRTSRILDRSPLRSARESFGQLRSYIALTLDESTDVKSQPRLRKRRNKSRLFAYDLRNYNPENGWGPYLNDGRVNWVHIEHLINVVLMNLRELPTMWTFTRPPMGLEATRPYSAPGGYSPDDWAGVQGTWRRYVCFMDYRDLFAFNFSDIPRDARFFEDPRFREATRLIEVKLHIVPFQQIRFYNDWETSADAHHPTLYFSGTSMGVSGNEAVVEGYVYMDTEGIARWQFMSIYDNSPQWSSNGVQIGDLGSAMGVVGVWTTTTHDQGDPVGPFWLWKGDDNTPAHLMEYT